MATGTCDYCGRPTYMAYKCRYCGGKFCPDHRLPENHDCPGLNDLRRRAKWSDYVAQVQRRDSLARGVNPSSRWDLQEENRGRRSFLGRMGRSSSYYQVDRLRSLFVTIFVVVILTAVALKLFF